MPREMSEYKRINPNRNISDSEGPKSLIEDKGRREIMNDII